MKQVLVEFFPFVLLLTLTLCVHFVDIYVANNLSIKDFEKYCHKHDQNWKIRGVVKAFRDVGMTLNPNLKVPYTFFEDR